MAPSRDRVYEVSSVAVHPASPRGVSSFPLLFSPIIPSNFCFGPEKQHPEQCSCLLALAGGTSLLTPLSGIQLNS